MLFPIRRQPCKNLSLPPVAIEGVVMSTNADAVSSNAAADAHAREEAPVKKLGKYLIEKKLGQGGMGAVYLGRDSELRRLVAIKVLPRDKASNPTLVRRFKAEAQAAAQLRHDNIVAVYDSDEAGGYLFIAMEYVDGHDLHEMISRRGTVPVKRSIEIIRQVAAALQHAHEHKIVHRDIKPSNLLIRNDGVVKLTDLGLARSVDDTIETGITRAGTTVGTVDYMAPEQARSSQAADIRSDLYSLGCTWFQMLTGQPPYPEGSLTNKLQAHAIKPIPDPREKNSNVTEGLVAVLRRLMAKKPEDRYQTPAELLEDLASSTLTQAAFSQEILNAIDEETGTPDRPEKAGADAVEAATPVSSRRSRKAARAAAETEDEPVEPETRAAARATTSQQPATASRAGKSPAASGKQLPPPRRQSLQESTDERPPSPWLERFKVILLIGGIMGLVGGVGWLASGLGNAFGLSSAITVVPKIDPETLVPIPAPEALPEQAMANATGERKEIPTGDATNPADASKGTGAAPGTGLPSHAISAAAVDQVRPTDPQQKPAWKPAPAPKGAGFSVGPGPVTGQHFRSLNDALLKLPGEGGVIKLIGNGPFPVTLTTPVKVRQLTVLGDPQAHSVIILTPGPDDRLGQLSFEGNIEFSHTHLLVDRHQQTSSEALTMLTVRQGSLLMSDSSLTVLSQHGSQKTGATNSSSSSSGPAITGLAMRGEQTPQALHLRRTIIRGEMTTGLLLKSSAIDAVIDESLLAVGNGPVFRFEGQSGLSDPTRSSRWLRVFASTLCSNAGLVDLTAESSLPQPPRTELVFRDTLGCTGPATGARTLLNVSDWLQQTVRDQITWTSRNSAFPGFARLIDLGQKSTFRADNATEWRQFWRQSVSDAEFIAGAWPEEISGWGHVTPGEFQPQQLPLEIRQVAENGEIPGVRPEWLRFPDELQPERFSAIAARPVRPTLTGFKPAAGNLAMINLREQDLGQVLARNEWPDGAEIRAVGFGICQMTPVKIQGKKLRLVFLQEADKGPLRIVPRESTTGAEGLFEIEDGTLELRGLRTQLPDFRPRHPGWVVSGRNAVISLDGCELRGHDATGESFQGIVRISGGPTEKSTPSTLMIQRSFLVAPGPLLRCEGGARLFASNSIFVTNDRMFEISLAADGTRVSGSADVTDCTLSSAGSVFRISPASLPAVATSAAGVYVDRCACVPPATWKVSATQAPVWLACDATVLEQKQLDWWGQENGAAKTVRTLMAINSVPPRELSTPEEMLAVLGAGHEQKFLQDSDGVVLANPLPSRIDQLEPSQFALHASSKAAKWSQGSPIGADLAELKAVGPQVLKASSPGKKATPKSSGPQTPKKSTQSAF